MCSTTNVNGNCMTYNKRVQHSAMHCCKYKCTSLAFNILQHTWMPLNMSYNKRERRLKYFNARQTKFTYHRRRLRTEYKWILRSMQLKKCLLGVVVRGPLQGKIVRFYQLYLFCFLEQSKLLANNPSHNIFNLHQLIYQYCSRREYSIPVKLNNNK